MSERVWRNAQECARKQSFATGSRGWVAACKSPKVRTRAKHAKSWRVAPAVALQDKSPRLARPLARGLNSRLNPVARSSRQNALFGKIWHFTFHSHSNINTPHSHDIERASKENFVRETLEKYKINSSTILTLETLQIPLLSSSPLLYPWEVFSQILISLHPCLWEGLFGAVKKQLGRNQSTLVDAMV